MQKYVQRRLTFNTNEVRDAIIESLVDRDRQYPVHVDQAKFTLTSNGAELSWAEDCEENF